MAAALALICLSACSKKPAPQAVETPASGVSFGSLQLGSSIGADKRVTAPVAEFQKNDTLYASVATNGSAPSATLTARWTYQTGQVVNESTQTIAPSGPTVTEFHIAKPDGWPPGDYKVEILLNGNSVATQTARVK